jgi:hypothetical protein
MKARENLYFKRQETKTSDGEFIHELLNSYELSIKLSEQILQSAKEILLREGILKEGQIEATVIEIEERAGKTIEKMEKKKVRLTIDTGMEDIESRKEFGRIVLREIRIQRITQEAIEQDGILSQEDLSRYLSCDVRTIRRDIENIKRRGIEVITRGVLHNIGRGQTHKKKIIGLYLEGYFYADIKLRTHHSVGAIKRYIQEFIKVYMSIERGIRDENEISTVTGISLNLTRQYKEILQESKGNKIRQQKLRFIKQQRSRGEKKTKTVTIGGLADLMTGGYR